ncbi:FAR-17a/AIG1-like protein [Trinorchestia longiramus]|nr:FAR-17a/AIG1-like protein [Trinorchestia longiramus]
MFKRSGPIFHMGLAVVSARTISFYEALQCPSDFVFKQIKEAYGGNYKFLTYLNVLLQLSYFSIALLNDIVGSDSRQSNKQCSLQRFRDWLFTTLVFPIGSFVAVVFWGLYFLDRELIFPASMDAWFPSWLNHLMHTLPLVAVIVETVIVYHSHQRGHSRLIPISVVYILYLSWLMYIRVMAGFWVYPVFEQLNTVGRIGFFFALTIPTMVLYVLGEKLHAAVWGSADSGQKKAKSKSK